MSFYLILHFCKCDGIPKWNFLLFAKRSYQQKYRNNFILQYWFWELLMWRRRAGFLNLFLFAAPFLGYKTIWQHSCYNLLVNRRQVQKLAAHLEVFRAPLEFFRAPRLGTTDVEHRFWSLLPCLILVSSPHYLFRSIEACSHDPIIHISSSLLLMLMLLLLLLLMKIPYTSYSSMSLSKGNCLSISLFFFSLFSPTHLTLGTIW